MSAALFLTSLDVSVLVIDCHAEDMKDPRAATFHPPTLEMFSTSGVTDRLHEQGYIVPTWQMRDLKKGLIAEFDMSALNRDTEYPYRLQCEQHKLVAILRAELAQRNNCEIIRGHKVTSVEQDAYGVTVTTENSEHSGRYLIGADGGRSTIRKSQNIDFEGFVYPEQFLVVTNTYDFEAEGYALSCYVSDPESWCAVFKVPGEGPPGLWRVVFSTDPNENEQTLLSHTYAQERLVRFLPREKPYEIVHTNLYKVHQRVASTYRNGRVMLAGDAAHINNPLGGMGMNFGIHDAHSLAEKLAAIMKNGASEDLLDLYDRQRRSVANEFLQKMTIDNKKSLEETNEVALRKRQAYLKETAADPEKARQHLMRTAMFEGLKSAEQIQ